ncbi:MAG: exodeoxyribonuclease VII small subunit [Erysipelotrichales bacterium]|nr:exodeoxyribonuclease VII small subunit [Erysipelotrichales bacterium]
MSEEKKMRYEEALKRLEEIVDTLEENRVPLEEAIRLFDEGLGLVQYCEGQIEAFDEKLNAVLKEHKIKDGEDHEL